MKKSIIISILAAVIAAMMVSCGGRYKYETVKGDPMHSRIYTLPNGLKVYMAVNKEEPRIQTCIAVRVGGKNDPAETTGLAHYFEHLMFKGTPNFGTMDYEAERPLLDEIEALFESYRATTDEAARTAIYHRIDSVSYVASGYAIPNEYDKLMSAIGANGTNAFTGNDMTVYIDDIPANQIDNWARIQADRFRNPVIRGFHTELETIYEEKNMSLTSDSRKVYETMLSSLFPNHPYGTQTVLGTQEHLKNPSITNVRNYHKQWYVPNNMAVCVSGDFDPDKMMATIDKYFGDMEPNPELPMLAFDELPAITAPAMSTVMGLEAENVTVAWRVGGANSPDNDLMTLTSDILNNGQAGLFDLDLIKRQVVLSAYAGYYDLADHGVLMMQGRPKAGQTLDEVKELLLAEVAKLKSGDFDEKLIEATIANYKASQMRSLDSNWGRAYAFVQAFINGVDWKDAVAQIDRIAKITKEDVVRFANERFADNNYALIYKREGKDPGEIKMPKPAITPIQTNRDAASAMLTEIRDTPVTPIEPVFVDYNRDMDRLTAQSEIEVLYKKNPTTDLFQLMYLYEMGSANDPTIDIAARYLKYLGTPTMSAEELASEFYRIACSFNISVGEERTYVSISGLSENMARAIELTEGLLASAVPYNDILDMLKGDLAKSRADAKLSQGQNFGRLQTYVRRGPAFIAANTLSADALKALTSTELLDKLKALSGQQHRVIYYGPKVQSEVLADLKEHHKVAENLVPVADKVRFPYPETPESNVVLAEYDAAQSYYMQYSNRGEKFDPANEAPSTLYNEYFGGGMNAIVFQEMREARGLAYSAFAQLATPWRLDIPYTYMAFIATQNDKLPQAALAFDDIINNMPESEKAFDLARSSLLTRMRTERVIKSDVLWDYIRAKDMGLDSDIRRTVWEKVPSMTLDDVRAFQQKWVAHRSYTYGILGRSADLDMKYLQSLGPVKRVTKGEIFGY